MGCLLVAHFTQLVVDSVSIPPWLSPHTALALAIKNPFHSKKPHFGLYLKAGPHLRENASTQEKKSNTTYSEGH